MQIGIGYCDGRLLAASHGPVLWSQGQGPVHSSGICLAAYPKSYSSAQDSSPHTVHRLRRLWAHIEEVLRQPTSPATFYYCDWLARALSATARRELASLCSTKTLISFTAESRAHSLEGRFSILRAPSRSSFAALLAASTGPSSVFIGLLLAFCR